MKRKGPLEGQQAFAWGEEPPEPPKAAESPPVAQETYTGKLLDESGHRWWAQFMLGCREDCLKKAEGDRELSGEWLSVAELWRKGAAKHERRADELAG